MMREKEGERKEALTRHVPAWPAMWNDPLRFMRRMMADVDRMFEDFGAGSWPTHRLFGDWESPAAGQWVPAVEVFQRDKEFVVRAELPGLEKKDIKIEVTDDALTIEGTRKEEKEEKEKGFYRSERCYGSFFRRISLPEGAEGEKARAIFKNGILEVIVPTPARETQKSRTLEITETGEPPKVSAKTAA